MAPKELNKALKELRWTGAELARRLGVTQSTTSIWRSATLATVPRYVEAYVTLALEMKTVRDRFAVLLKR